MAIDVETPAKIHSKSELNYGEPDNISRLARKLDDVIDGFMNEKTGRLESNVRGKLYRVPDLYGAVNIINTLYKMSDDGKRSAITLLDIDGTLDYATGVLKSILPVVRKRMPIKDIFDPSITRLNELKPPFAIVTNRAPMVPDRDRPFLSYKYDRAMAKILRTGEVFEYIRSLYPDVSIFPGLNRQNIGSGEYVDSRLVSYLASEYDRQRKVLSADNENLSIFLTFDTGTILSAISDSIGGEAIFFKRIIPELAKRCPNIQNYDLYLIAIDRNVFDRKAKRNR